MKDEKCIYVDNILFKEITDDHIYGVKPGQYVNLDGIIYCPDSNFKNKYRQPVYGCNPYGRVRVYMNDGTTYLTSVHRLIMMVFNPIENSENLIINHIDGNKRNNNLSNLEWTTYQDNTIHAYNNNLNPTGELHHCSKLSEHDVKEICQNLEQNRYYGEYSDLSKKYNISSSVISSIAKGKTWKKESCNFNIDYSAAGVNSKLTEKDVENICQELSESRYRGQAVNIAQRYNVTPSTIKEIISGRSWQNISSKYNIQKALNQRLTEDEIHYICKLIENNNGFDENVYRRILLELDLEDNNHTRHNILRLVRKDPNCYFNITSQYKW